VCDKEMLRELDDITNPTLRERLDRGIVRNLIIAKVDMGLGLKKIPAREPVKSTEQLAEGLHKPVSKNKFEKDEFTLKELIRFSPQILSICNRFRGITTE